MKTEVVLTVAGLAQTIEEVQRLRTGFARRGRLHERIAGRAENLTKDYVLATATHRTAERLGAKPTHHRVMQARNIDSVSTAEASVVRIPRVSGLGRAFRDLILIPKNGKKFLTIPASAETYGRRAGEWPEGTFKFAIIYTHRGPTPVLVWAESGGGHKKNDVAYWLRRKVTQKQDRGLLPSDQGYLDIATMVVEAWADDLVDGEEGAV